MTNKEAFLKLVSEEDTETLKEIKERIQKRKDMTPKEEQKKLLTEIMEADAKDGLYNQECCTPEGQIKRYVDCIGCDRKPEERVLVLSESTPGTIVEHSLLITSQKYKLLLAIQKQPKPAIYFKDQEISAEKLIEILEKAEIE